MPILKYVKKFPAGTMVIPLLLASFINTFFHDWLYIGGYTQALFSSDGMNTMLGLMMLFTGTQLSFKDIPTAFVRGGTYVLVKWIIGASFYFFIISFFGNEGVFGICSLAFLCALTNCNGSMYMGLIETYGDMQDMAARPIFNISSSPMITLITLGLSGAVSFGFKDIMSILIPLFVGMILANLDSDIKEATKGATGLIMPLMGFVLGAGINLKSMVTSGLSGVLLFGVVVVLTGPIIVLIDRLIFKRSGYAALSTVSVAGNTLAVPAAVAAVAPEFLPYVESAMISISGSIILSTIFTPLMVHYMAKKYGCAKYKQVFGKEYEKVLR